MIIQRPNGTHPAMRLRSEVDRLCGGFFETFSPAELFSPFVRKAFPAVNVWEDDLTLFAEAELPGVKMDDVEVYVVGDELTIKGERKGGPGENVTHRRHECAVGSFNRVLRLPVEVDVNKVHATLRDGVLTITLPKAKAAIPLKIQVKG